MMLLHWFVSQSIFLDYITGKDHDQCDVNDVPRDVGIVTLGVAWPPFALILALIVDGVLIVTLWIRWLRDALQGWHSDGAKLKYCNQRGMPSKIPGCECGCSWSIAQVLCDRRGEQKVGHRAWRLI